MKIKSLSEIDYNSGQNIKFDATVINILSPGDVEKKRPLKMTLKLEESGETVMVSTWKFDNEQKIKDLVESLSVYEFEGVATVSAQYGQQIRVGNIVDMGYNSGKKILTNVSPDEIKREMAQMISVYIPNSSPLKKLTQLLTIENEKFLKWPAATKVHHNYPGGLAKHSLNVCKNAVAMWNTYKGENISLELVVAGALLHDIGKLKEYNEDGSRTIFGNLLPHPISGVETVLLEGTKLGIDPNDTRLIMLRHIITSHHEKLEYGAGAQPGIAEALIVAKADAEDAAVESAIKSLSNLNTGETSERLLALDGATMLRWQ